MTLACHRSAEAGFQCDKESEKTRLRRALKIQSYVSLLEPRLWTRRRGQVSEIYPRQLTIRRISPVRSYKLVIIDGRVYIRERYRGGVVIWRKDICFVVGRHIHHVAVEPLGKIIGRRAGRTHVLGQSRCAL